MGNEREGCSRRKKTTRCTCLSWVSNLRRFRVPSSMLVVPPFPSLIIRRCIDSLQRKPTDRIQRSCHPSTRSIPSHARFQRRKKAFSKVVVPSLHPFNTIESPFPSKKESASMHMGSKRYAWIPNPCGETKSIPNPPHTQDKHKKK